MSKIGKFNISLVFVICLLCVLCCTTALADGTDDTADYSEVPVYVDGILSCRGYTIDGDTYVSPMPFAASSAMMRRVTSI